MDTDRTLPNTGAVFLLFAILLGVYLFISLILSGLPREEDWYLISLLVPELAILLLPLVFIRVKRLNFRATLKIESISFTTGWLTFFIALIAFIVLGGLNDLLSPLFKSYEEMTIRMVQQLIKAAESNIIIFLIGVTIVPAICEEVLFRGFILSGLQAEHGKTKAVVFSGLLFGLLHFIPNQIVLMSLFGMLLGFLTLQTGSILVPMLLHFVNNVLAVTLILQPQLWNSMKATPLIYLLILVSSIVLLGTSILLLKFLAKRFNQY